jgi:DNA polymerase beta
METKRVKKERKKATRKKKLVFIIDSSSSSSSKKRSSSRKTKKHVKTGEHPKSQSDISSLTFSSLSSLTTPFEKEKTNLKKSHEIVYSMTESTIPLPSGRLNEKLIELMETLSDIMLKQGEPFRARAYQKAQETIMAYPNDITGPEQLVGLSGIGPTIIEKINEYVATGTLRVIEREKNNPVNVLGDIYGIGPKKAKELVEKHGIKTIEQLRQNQQLLNDVQKVGLKYYEDILKRIPRNEIDQFNAILKSIQQSVKTPFHYEIVGSYRRGAESSGDIDVIITSESSAGIFKELIDLLIKENIIVEVLSRGATKCLVIAKVPGFDAYRRVDFLFTGGEEFPFAILYFTGSKIFNTVMRQYALQKGLTMNEHGLHRLEGKKKGEKVDHFFHEEKDIFDYLGLEYKLPEERKDGRAVIPQKKMNENEGLNKGLNEGLNKVLPEQMPKKDKQVRVKKETTIRNKLKFMKHYSFTI